MSEEGRIVIADRLGHRYADYPCFHQIMGEDSNLTVTAQLFDVLLPLAPGLTAEHAFSQAPSPFRQFSSFLQERWWTFP